MRKCLSVNDSSWQLAVAIHLAASTAFALFYRKFAQVHSGKALLSTALMYITTVLAIGVIAALMYGNVSFHFPVYLWLYLVLGGVLFAVANVTAFMANTHIDAGQFSIISNFKVVVTIFVSSLLLRETLSGIQLVGVILLLIAAFIVTSLKFNKKTLTVDKFTIIAGISAALFGLGISNEKFLLNNMSFSTYLIAGWGMQTAAMVVIAAKELHGTQDFLKNGSGKRIMVLGMLRACAGLGLVYALNTLGNSSLIAGMTSYTTALVVVGSYFILKEKDGIRVKIIGTVAATIGLLLLLK